MSELVTSTITEYQSESLAVRDKMINVESLDTVEVVSSIPFQEPFQDQCQEPCCKPPANVDGVSVNLDVCSGECCKTKTEPIVACHSSAKVEYVPCTKKVITEIVCEKPAHGKVDYYDGSADGVPPNEVDDWLILTSGSVKESGEKAHGGCAHMEDGADPLQEEDHGVVPERCRVGRRHLRG